MAQTTEAQTRRPLRSKAVKQLLGCSTATLYRYMASQGFPKPRKVGSTSTNYWDSVEVHAWIAAQLDKRPGSA